MATEQRFFSPEAAIAAGYRLWLTPPSGNFAIYAKDEIVCGFKRVRLALLDLRPMRYAQAPCVNHPGLCLEQCGCTYAG